MKLVYIAMRPGGVFDSQVLSLLNYFAKSKFYFKEIYLLIGIRSIKDVNLIKTKKINKKISIIYFQNFSSHFLIYRMTINSIYRALSKIEIDKNTIIHCRGNLMGYYVYKILKKKEVNTNRLLIDIRGAYLEEIKEFSNSLSIVKRWKIKLTKKSLKEIDNSVTISVVSSSLKNYFIQKTRKDNFKININSCLVQEDFIFNEESRKKIRNKLNINNDEVVFIFSTGGNSKWQNTEKIIKNIANKGFKIINLSKEIFEHKNVFSLFVPYEKVPEYLSAADIAIILRDKSIVNKVASPVKYSEYFCCGLPIIANNTVDLIKYLIEKHHYGKLIENFDEIDNILILSLKKLNRIEISNCGLKYFSVSRIGKKYYKIYKDMLSKN